MSRNTTSIAFALGIAFLAAPAVAQDESVAMEDHTPHGRTVGEHTFLPTRSVVDPLMTKSLAMGTALGYMTADAPNPDTGGTVTLKFAVVDQRFSAQFPLTDNLAVLGDVAGVGFSGIDAVSGLLIGSRVGYEFRGGGKFAVPMGSLLVAGTGLVTKEQGYAISPALALANVVGGGGFDKNSLVTKDSDNGFEIYGSAAMGLGRAFGLMGSAGLATSGGDDTTELGGAASLDLKGAGGMPVGLVGSFSLSMGDIDTTTIAGAVHYIGRADFDLGFELGLISQDDGTVELTTTMGLLSMQYYW